MSSSAASLPTDFPTVRETIEAYGLNAKKSLGQNFLTDLNITDKIVRQTRGLEGKIVVEIGPGPGGLTRALLTSAAKKVIVIEKDERCIAALETLKPFFPERLDIIEGDALKIDWTAFCDEKFVIVANLPYNISTVLLAQWLEHIDYIDHMVLMFQREVADRITAAPKNSAYGRLSVISQWKATPHQMFHLPGNVFWPPPKVESTIVRFDPAPSRPEDPPFKAVEKVTQAAFGQRRKMLRASLKSLGFTADSLENMGISADKRAEELAVTDFLKLAKCL